MDRYAERGRDALRRAAFDYYLRGGRQEESTQHIPSAQQVPVNVYETEEDVVIVAPMPGVESDNIDIEVVGTTVVLRAGLRGAGQADRRYLIHEWTYGPYERQVELPIEVDAEHANASHGNGVLVLSLPKARAMRTVKVRLGGAGSSGASHRGHSGHHTTRDGLQE